MRLRLTAGLAALALALLVAPAASAKPVDRASARAAIQAWITFVDAADRLLPTARTRLGQLSAGVSSGCPGVLDGINSTPPEQLNWEAVDNHVAAVVVDTDVTASTLARPAFDRFAARVKKLRWSSGATKSAIARDLQLHRRYLTQATTDICARSREWAAAPGSTPLPTLQFVRLGSRNGTAAGLNRLGAFLAKFAGPRERPLQRRLGTKARSYQRQLLELIGQKADSILDALRLIDPPKVLTGDRTATSNARNLVSQVEACFTETQDYNMCHEPPGTGLPLGSGPGQVEVTESTGVTWVIVAHSTSGADFKIAKDENAVVKRTCSRPGVGLCRADGTW